MPSSTLYTLSLHDALPICDVLLLIAIALAQRRASLRTGRRGRRRRVAIRGYRDRSLVLAADVTDGTAGVAAADRIRRAELRLDRKSTRLNSSHSQISYAVFHALHSFPTRRSSDLRRSSSDCDRSCTAARIPADRSARSPSACSNSGLPRSVPGPGSRCHRRDSRCRRSRSNPARRAPFRSEEHTSELQSQSNLVCRLPRSTLFPYTTLFRSATFFF